MDNREQTEILEDIQNQLDRFNFFFEESALPQIKEVTKELKNIKEQLRISNAINSTNLVYKLAIDKTLSQEEKYAFTKALNALGLRI